jgi:hypothetical protein
MKLIIQQYLTIKFAFPILCYLIMLFEGVQEVVGVILDDVLNSKVVYHQGEGYMTRFVTPQTACVFDGVATMRC